MRAFVLALALATLPACVTAQPPPDAIELADATPRRAPKGENVEDAIRQALTQRLGGARLAVTGAQLVDGYVITYDAATGTFGAEANPGATPAIPGTTGQWEVTSTLLRPIGNGTEGLGDGTHKVGDSWFAQNIYVGGILLIGGSNALEVYKFDDATVPYGVAASDFLAYDPVSGDVKAALSLGSNVAGLTTPGLALAASATFRWDSSSSVSANTPDSGLGRSRAGVVAATDGSTGRGQLEYRVVYEVHASDDTLDIAETGSTHTNSGAATRTLTLPTVSVAGVNHGFVSLVSSQVLRIDPGANEKFVGLAGGWADGEFMELDQFEAVEIVSQADGDWCVTYVRGTPAEQTP